MATKAYKLSVSESGNYSEDVVTNYYFDYDDARRAIESMVHLYVDDIDEIERINGKFAKVKEQESKYPFPYFSYNVAFSDKISIHRVLEVKFSIEGIEVN